MALQSFDGARGSRRDGGAPDDVVMEARGSGRGERIEFRSTDSRGRLSLHDHGSIDNTLA